MLLKACLNGSRRIGEHPALPVTPEGLASATVAAVAAGAGAVHLHVKNEAGADTLEPTAVAQTLTAVRVAAPRTPVGITTGAWTARGPQERLVAVRRWQVLPDFASVNWHEAGAEQLAATLLELGVGVEAGLWTPATVAAWNGWSLRHRCLRVLLEVVDDLPAAAAVAAAGRLLDALEPVAGVPVLLHGESGAAWPVFTEAVRRGLDLRIGLEDTLLLPTGQLATDNAALVAAGREIISRHS